MSEKEEKVVTGEYGFCSDCGQVVSVVVTPADRLSSRLLRSHVAIEKAERVFREEAVERLRLSVSDLVSDATVAKAAAISTLAASDLDRGVRLIEGELRKRLKGSYLYLIVAEQAFGELLDEPLDLLHEITEELEAQADFINEEGSNGQSRSTE